MGTTGHTHRRPASTSLRQTPSDAVRGRITTPADAGLSDGHDRAGRTTWCARPGFWFAEESPAWSAKHGRSMGHRCALFPRVGPDGSPTWRLFLPGAKSTGV